MPKLLKDALFEKLSDLGIETRTVDHEAIFTVAESRLLDQSLPGAHTKNLFLKDAKGQLFLVVARAESEVDLKGLPKRINSARLSFGKSELLQQVLGGSTGFGDSFCSAE